MSYEIINTLKGGSIIRISNPGTYTITLNQLSSNTSLETVTSASIRKMIWSTNGSITVTRTGQSEPMVTVFNQHVMKFDEFGTTLSNTATANIVVTLASGGFCMLDVSKTATYSTNNLE
jgi:hypothetical protein